MWPHASTGDLARLSPHSCRGKAKKSDEVNEQLVARLDKLDESAQITAQRLHAMEATVARLEQLLGEVLPPMRDALRPHAARGTAPEGPSAAPSSEAPAVIPDIELSLPSPQHYGSLQRDDSFAEPHGPDGPSPPPAAAGDAPAANAPPCNAPAAAPATESRPGVAPVTVPSTPDGPWEQPPQTRSASADAAPGVAATDTTPAPSDASHPAPPAGDARAAGGGRIVVPVAAAAAPAGPTATPAAPSDATATPNAVGTPNGAAAPAPTTPRGPAPAAGAPSLTPRTRPPRHASPPSPVTRTFVAVNGATRPHVPPPAALASAAAGSPPRHKSPGTSASPRDDPGVVLTPRTPGPDGLVPPPYDTSATQASPRAIHPSPRVRHASPGLARPSPRGGNASPRAHAVYVPPHEHAARPPVPPPGAQAPSRAPAARSPDGLPPPARPDAPPWRRATLPQRVRTADRRATPHAAAPPDPPPRGRHRSSPLRGPRGHAPRASGSSPSPRVKMTNL